jgi:hypothetical protein
MTRSSLHLRRGLVASMGACLWLLSSCGGGVPGSQASNTGGDGGVGSGGTGSYTNGPISGLGSIIVNGVRYDVSQASVISDDGLAHTPSDLNLGMQVEVSGGTVAAGVGGALPSASAAQVRFASALLGPVEQLPDTSNGGCSCLKVLGQTVKFTAATVMPANLSTSDVVEVFGQPDLTGGAYLATRVQVVGHAQLPYKLVGWVRGSNAINLAAHTVVVTGPTSVLTLKYTDGQLTDLEEMGSGSRPVRVWLQREVDAQSRHPLAKLSLDRPLVTDRKEASLDGLVTSTVDANGLMALNGVVVDVSPLSPEQRASLSALPLGQALRVEGRLVAGTLQVTEFHLPGQGGGDDDSGIELHGAPTEVTPLSVSTATMVVRGVTVVFDPRTAPANLASLSCIEVEGSAFNADGQLVAESVRVDTGCH